MSVFLVGKAENVWYGIAWEEGDLEWGFGGDVNCVTVHVDANENHSCLFHRKKVLSYNATQVAIHVCHPHAIQAQHTKRSVEYVLEFSASRVFLSGLHLPV